MRIKGWNFCHKDTKSSSITKLFLVKSSCLSDLVAMLYNFLFNYHIFIAIFKGRRL